MGDRQWLVIKNLTQYGLTNLADSFDLPPNALTYCTGYGFYRGRISKCNRFGAKSTTNTIFNGTTYNTGDLWQLYNSGILKLKAGTFAEYENSAGTRYEIPCWLGMFSTVVQSTGVATGQSLDANWHTTTFPRAPNKWLTTNDKVFLSAMATPTLAKNFTDLGGGSGGEVALNTYADWTDSSSAIKQRDTGSATYNDTAYNTTITEGLAFNSGAIASITNQLFTIRKIKLIAQYSRAALIVRDNTTKRGYALEVERTTESMAGYYTFTCRADEVTPPTIGDEYTNNSQTFTITGHEYTNTGLLVLRCTGTGLPVSPPSAACVLRRSTGFTGGLPLYHYINRQAGGPVMVTIRLWDGYFVSTNTNLGDYAAVVWEKTNVTDWFDGTYNETHYEDLWMWWRDSFVTFGYGPNAIGCVPISSTPSAARVGFMLNNAYIAAASAGKYCIYSFNVGTNQTGPYTVSALAATTATITSAPANGDYIIWACKYANRKKIVPAADYVIFCNDNTSSANFPASMWRGGMMEEVPLTNPSYDQNWAWGANDIAIFKGRVFLAGTQKMISKIGASGYYEWITGLKTPTAVKWSAPFLPFVWEDQFPDGTPYDYKLLAGNIDFAETNGPVNAIGQLRDVLIVYKQDSVAMLSPTGIYSDPFQVDYMSWTVGVGNPRCLGITPLTHYFHSSGHLWQVEMGEITIVPLRVNTFDTDKIFMLPNEDTVLFGKSSTPAAGCCRMIGYNWKYNACYLTYIPLEQVSVKYGYVFGIDSAGKYTYTSETSTIITDTALYLHYDYTNYPDIIQTPMIDFGDSEHDKTVFTIDIYARSWSEPPSGLTPLPIYVKITSDRTSVASDWTEVTGKFITIDGGDIYNNPSEGETYCNLYRYTGVFTGRAFQISVKDYSVYARNDFFRVVVEYETLGPTKK